MKKISLIGLLGIFLAVALQVSAGDPLQNPKVVKDLGLTQEQTAKLEQLRYDFQASSIKLREEMQLVKLDLKREMAAENPDKTKINKLVDHLSQVRARMAKARVNHLLDVRSILTTEQWNRLKELRAKFGHRQGRRGGNAMGKGRGGMRGNSGMCPNSGNRMGPGGGQGMGPGPGPDAGPDAPDM